MLTVLYLYVSMKLAVKPSLTSLSLSLTVLLLVLSKGWDGILSLTLTCTVCFSLHARHIVMRQALGNLRKCWLGRTEEHVTARIWNLGRDHWIYSFYSPLFAFFGVCFACDIQHEHDQGFCLLIIPCPFLLLFYLVFLQIYLWSFYLT